MLLSKNNTEKERPLGNKNVSQKNSLIYGLGDKGDKIYQKVGLKSSNSSALSLLYGPTLTSVCDYWRNHSFD